MRLRGEAAAGTEGNRRLFIAIILPDLIRRDFATLQDHSLPSVAWTREEQLHLTLKFIGDRDASEIETICSALASIRSKSFILEAAGIGRFPQKGIPRIIWVGYGSAHPHLFQIKFHMENSLLALGIEADPRVYQPHTTLGRCTDSNVGAIEQFIKGHRDYRSPPFRVDAFHLFESRLKRSGAEHTVLASFKIS